MPTSTQDLFRDDARLRECSATLVRVEADAVILDRPVFYPLGAGRPEMPASFGWLLAASCA